MKTTDSNYPFKSNPLTFDDVALAASIQWAVSEKSAKKFFIMFADPTHALEHLKANRHPSNEFWASL